MKEKIWIYIPQNYKEMLIQWKEYYAYDTEDKKNGKLVAYNFYIHSKDYKELSIFLEKNNIYSYIFRREYSFSKKDLENSEILRFWTDDDAKDSYVVGTEYDRCDKCGSKKLSLDGIKLHVDYKKIKRYDIMSTYVGDTETIVSQKVKLLFEKENISGVKYEPIYQMGKENKIIDGFYHLIIQEGIGEIIEPSIVERGSLCSKCGTYEYFLCKTLLNFNRSTWKNLDICYIKDWFGSFTKSKNIIISNKLYRVLVENNIKNVYFQPAYFILN